MAAQSCELSRAEEVATGSCPDRPLRVLLDARKLGDGGIGVYIDNLIRGLLEIGGVRLTLIARPGARDTLAAADGQGYAGAVEWIEDRARRYSCDELVGLARRIDFRGFDLFHAPHYTLPWGIPIPKVVTVHDLIHISHPERFFYPWIARPLIRSAVRRADRVVTVSEATREAVLRLTGAPAERVVCVPNAVPVFLATESPAAPPSQRGEGTPQHAEFLLAIFSNRKPHKGCGDLLAAYARYRAECIAGGAAPLRLLVAGYGTLGLLPQPGVDVLGAVSPERLRVLYQRATALVVPSLMEGFCLPVLEAQACGTPVVARPVAAIRELLVDGDCVAQDFSGAALAQAIATAAAGAGAARRPVDRARLERYSCAHTADRIRAVYRAVCGRAEAGLAPGRQVRCGA